MTEAQRHTRVASELKRLAALHGGELRPKAVVDAARDPKSPIHDSFEWDDSTAAEHWRVQQARVMICAVVTYEQTGKGKLIPCRVFVSLTPDRKHDGAGYRVAATVLSDVVQRAQMLADARDEMQRFKAKYHALNELAEVFAAMDAATHEDLAHTA